MLSKFLKLFVTEPFEAPANLADKVADLQAQAEQQHATAVAQAQEAHNESARLWAKSELLSDEAARLKTLADKLGALIDPAA